MPARLYRDKHGFRPDMLAYLIDSMALDSPTLATPYEVHQAVRVIHMTLTTLHLLCHLLQAAQEHREYCNIPPGEINPRNLQPLLTLCALRFISHVDPLSFSYLGPMGEYKYEHQLIPKMSTKKPNAQGPRTQTVVHPFAPFAVVVLNALHA